MKLITSLILAFTVSIAYGVPPELQKEFDAIKALFSKEFHSEAEFVRAMNASEDFLAKNKDKLTPSEGAEIGQLIRFHPNIQWLKRGSEEGFAYKPSPGTEKNTPSSKK